MKQLSLMIIGMLIYCACNESPEGTATERNRANDRDTSDRIKEPTPGLGYDPTRNDVTKKNPLPADAVDSTGPANKDKPTPALRHAPADNGPYPVPDDKKPEENKRTKKRP